MRRLFLLYEIYIFILGLSGAARYWRTPLAGDRSGGQAKQHISHVTAHWFTAADIAVGTWNAKYPNPCVMKIFIYHVDGLMQNAGGIFGYFSYFWSVDFHGFLAHDASEVRQPRGCCNFNSVSFIYLCNIAKIYQNSP